jgi:hypothetical protein
MLLARMLAHSLASIIAGHLDNWKIGLFVASLLAWIPPSFVRFAAGCSPLIGRFDTWPWTLVRLDARLFACWDSMIASILGRFDIWRWTRSRSAGCSIVCLLEQHRIHWYSLTCWGTRIPPVTSVSSLGVWIWGVGATIVRSTRTPPPPHQPERKSEYCEHAWGLGPSPFG